MKEVWIRADGDQEMGHGHVARCFSISMMLKDKFSIRWFYKTLPPSWPERISEFFEIKQINQESEFLDILEENQLVITDGYAFDSEYQYQVKEKKAVLVVIDDLVEGNYYADLIINTSPGVCATDYLAQAYTHYALGLPYVLLRPEFLALAGTQAEKKQGSLIICFGGADPDNLTLRSCELAIQSGCFTEINVVAGSSYAFTTELKKYLSTNNIFKYYHDLNAQSMAALMSRCETAIVPSSGILHEAIAAGCKPISGFYISNQKHIYRFYKQLNAIVDAGSFEMEMLRQAIDQVGNTVLNRALIDGQSGIRILDKIVKMSLKKDITFRKVNMQDIELTYNWARNAQIRKYAFSKHLISAHEHHNWLRRKMLSRSCVYFIIEFKHIPIGSIRFDIINDHAIISYLADSSLHGKGFGKSILSLGIYQFEKYARSNDIYYSKIIGYVKHDNLKSLYIFKDLNFKAQAYKNFTKFTFNLPSRNTLKVGLLVSGALGYTCMKHIRHYYDTPFVFTDRSSTQIIKYCEEQKIPVFVGNPRTQNITDFLKQHRIDVLFSINYLFLIGKELINKPERYALNIHGSLLPKYRGRTPHVWAIINGEKKTGITVHKIDIGCDTGEIVYQEKIPIMEHDTGADLLRIFKQRYPHIVTQLLQKIKDKDISSKKQDESKSSYFEKRTPEDGKIDWLATDRKIIDWVRALSNPYPGAFTFYQGKKIIIDRVSKDEIEYPGKYQVGEIVQDGLTPTVKSKFGFLRIEKVRNKNISFEKGTFFEL